jgi:hypothetical protein
LKKHVLLFFFFSLSIAAQSLAQQTAVYVEGSVGLSKSYLSGGLKRHLKSQAILSLEGGGGLLGIQSELASAGNSPNLTGQSGFESSIASSIVIAPDPNVPDHAYPGSVTTTFTGSFIRGSYEWHWGARKNTTSQTKGLRAGIELAYFSIIQGQDIQYRSFNSSYTYDYHGTAWAGALAPGLRLGYDCVFGKHFLFSPELATPFYMPIGRHAKTNGPFGSAAVEVRLAIGWFFL